LNFQTAADTFVASLDTPRRRGILAGNTRRLYEAYTARACKSIGTLNLAEISNLIVRNYISELRQSGLAPSTIQGHFAAFKLVVESVRNYDGDSVYAKKWNLDYINLPIVNPADQTAPAASREDIEKALAIPDNELSLFVALAAASGSRVSELMALQIGDVPGEDCLDLTAGVIHVRKTLKTSNAARTIHLPIAFASWLRNRITHTSGPVFTLPRLTIYRRLAKNNLPAPHSYRRFFTTVRRKAGMNEQVLRGQLGHALDSSVTDRYSRVSDDVDFIKREVERCGLGFSLETV